MAYLPELHLPVFGQVVSYDFKQTRFAEMHRAAIGFPRSRFTFVGTPAVAEARAGALEGEAKTLKAFQRDPYGCHGLLMQKRKQRDPFARTLPYPNGCVELRDLFSYCANSIYHGKLPW